MHPPAWSLFAVRTIIQVFCLNNMILLIYNRFYCLNIMLLIYSSSYFEKCRLFYTLHNSFSWIFIVVLWFQVALQKAENAMTLAHAKIYSADVALIFKILNRVSFYWSSRRVQYLQLCTAQCLDDSTSTISGQTYKAFDFVNLWVLVWMLFKFLIQKESW